MKKRDEEDLKYTAFSPATWLVIIQLLMVHWKIAYALPIEWWVVFLPLLLVAGTSIFAGAMYLVGATVAYSRSKLSRKPSF